MIGIKGKRCDTYKEVRTLHFDGMIARVHIPDIDESERCKRLRIVRKAAENLLKERATQKHETVIHTAASA